MTYVELVAEYLFHRFDTKKQLSFPDYLLPQNRYKNDFWITQDGRMVYPRDMSNHHLVNTVKLLHKGNPALQHTYHASKADSHILFGKAVFQGKRKKALKRTTISMYYELWEENRIYMLLRREIKIRGIESYL